MNLRKFTGIFLSVTGTVVTGIILAVIIKAYNSVDANNSIAIIGGADEPTAVFLISRGGSWLFIALIAGIAMFTAGIVMLLKKKNNK